MKQPLSAWKISEIMAVELWCLKGKSMGKSIIVEVLMETHDIYTVYTCGKHALLSNVHINGLLHNWENHHHHHFIIEVNGENMASTKGLLKHPSWVDLYMFQPCLRIPKANLNGNVHQISPGFDHIKLEGEP